MSDQPDKAISYGAAIVAEDWKLYNVNDVCVKLRTIPISPFLKPEPNLTRNTVSSSYSTAWTPETEGKLVL